MMESDSSQLGPNALMFAEHVLAMFVWADIDPEPYHPIVYRRKADNAVGFAIATRPHDLNSFLHCFEDGVEGFHVDKGVSLLINEDNPASLAAIAATAVILTNQPAGDALTKLAEEK